jgi:hypothetical protein
MQINGESNPNSRRQPYLLQLQVARSMFQVVLLYKLVLLFSISISVFERFAFFKVWHHFFPARMNLFRRATFILSLSCSSPPGRLGGASSLFVENKGVEPLTSRMQI